MKTTRKHNTIRRIVAAMLTLALVLTGITLDNTVTVDAAATTIEQFQTGSTITMKPGETKRLLVTSESGEDLSEAYNWKCSNDTIVGIEVDFVDTSVDLTCCMILTARKSGTVTITGKPYNYEDSELSMKVNVKMSGPTVKQKKCKHVWKTTKKPTCQRVGIKTCKKCHLQKEVKRVPHKFVKKTFNVTTYEFWTTERQCNVCRNEFETDTIFETDKVSYKYGVPYSEDEEYLKAYAKMCEEFNEHCRKEHPWSGAWVEWENEYGQQTITVTDGVCKYCGADQKPYEAYNRTKENAKK